MNSVIEMERKVSKFGNSLSITMTDDLKQIGLDQGDTVLIDVNEAMGGLLSENQIKSHCLIESARTSWIL
ncbi:hypothetical protein NSS79_00970 [Paenibacillus sp. FSL L8-0436]|uniref:AbrB/MazE/SpoVT family DNA-binding domain-containing protein n=1 Tax=unclassified Paenibacillus TaxID=185978 RepID=UPI0031593EB1